MIQTQNREAGFFGTILSSRSEEEATQEWDRAVATIRAARPNASDAVIRNYLDSVYGRHTAVAVLNRTPVRAQIEERPARFRKHFEQIERQTAAGHFPSP